MESNSEQSKSDRNDRLISILNSAFFIVILPAIVFVLSFSYNMGYNSYFNLPLYFTDASINKLMGRIPLIINSIEILLAIVFIASMIIKIYRKVKPPQENDIPQKKSFAIGILSTAVFACFILVIGIIDHNVLFCISSIIFILTTFIMFMSYNSFKRVSSHNNYSMGTKKTEDNSASVSSAKKELESGIQNLDNSIKWLKVYPTSKFWRIFLVCAFSSLFIVTFYYFGQFTARNQDSFYMIDENRLIVSSYNNDCAIIAYVNYDSGLEQFTYNNQYAIIPLENLEFKYIQTGKIKTKESIPSLDTSWKFID